MTERTTGNDTEDRDTAVHVTGWRKVWFVMQVIQVRLRFVLLLVITGFVIGYWDHITNWWDKYTRPPVQEQTAASLVEFFCPMHTFIVRSEPGKCPICGMPLTQRAKGEASELPEGVLARVQASPERVAQAGVEIATVDYRILARETRSVGTIDYDEQALARATARFPGRIEKLFVNYVGAEVKKGEPLARIYSPKYLAATEEFVQSLRMARASDKGASEEERRRANMLVGFSKQRLLLAGFEPEQVDEIEKGGEVSEYVTYYAKISGVVIERQALEGEYVGEGQVLFTVAELKTLWVQVAVPEPESAAAKIGIPVELTTVAYPGEVFYGNVGFVSPTVDPATRSVRVRVEIDNSAGRLKPGMYVTAIMRSPLGEFLEIGDAGSSDSTSSVSSHGKHAQQETTASSPDMLSSLSVYYQCDMHPEVISGQPGDCPKCGMHLTRHEGVVPHLHDATSSGSASAATEMAYVCEMCPDVLADKPGKCPTCGMDLTPRISAESDEAARWAEGYTCAMHPEVLRDKPGVCDVCPCKMPTTRWRVEKVLALPERAVVDTGTRKIVYVEAAPGVFEAKEVVLGPRAGRFYQLLSGLNRGDRIAAAGSFLIDAENRLNPVVGSIYAPKIAQDRPAGHQH
jgi:RND family efflux transporter MFP subunit